MIGDEVFGGGFVQDPVRRTAKRVSFFYHGIQHPADFFETGVQLRRVSGRNIAAVQNFANVLRFHLLGI